MRNFTLGAHAVLTRGARAIRVTVIALWAVSTMSPLASTLAAQSPDHAHLGFRLRTSMLMDSNLEHDETPDRAYGGVLGMGFDFQSSRTRPVLTVRYEVARHQYSIPAQWNRISQSGVVRLAVRPLRRLTLETNAEVTLKGSSEDRDLGDQYVARETIGWRPWRRTTLEATAAMRLRRYQDNLDRNATNRYAEVELAQRIVGTVEVKGSMRAERNEGDGARYRYGRSTGEMELETPMPVGRLTIGGRLRRQEYDARFVKEISDTTHRVDWRRQGTATWEVWPWRSLGIVMEYQFEGRHSNDPGKAFVAHQVGLSIQRVW